MANDDREPLIAGLHGKRKKEPIIAGVGKNNETVKLDISGKIIRGGPLSSATITAINAAAKTTPKQWRHYIAYEGKVKVGGVLAWRANNPGNQGCFNQDRFGTRSSRPLCCLCQHG